MPTQIKLLLKKVNTKSSAGDLSKDDILDAHCYITIPSVIEIDSSYDSAPYASEGTSISYLTTDSTRKRAYVDGEYATYWLRSPSVPSWSSTKYYVFAVQSSGSVYEINTPTTEHGVLIEISF
jgi:hypothetical protein